jgi:hypothetical protein
MASDILDSILSSKSNVSAGLQKVCNFIGKHGLAVCGPDGKCLVGTPTGLAQVGALKPATELMEKAISGDKQAKGYIARMKQKADAGDPRARGTMGVLDVTAMALRQDQDFGWPQYHGDFATQFMPGFERHDWDTMASPSYEGVDWADNRGEYDEVEFGVTDQNLPSQYVTYGAGAGVTTVIDASGKRRNFKSLAAAKNWVSKNPGSRVVSTMRSQGERPGQARGAAQKTNRQFASQQQIQSAINRVPPTQRQSLVSRIQQQQQVNMQQGMIPGGAMGQPIYPGQPGYPYPQGSQQYGQPFYMPGAQGYAPGYGPQGYGQPMGMYGVNPAVYGGPIASAEDFADDGTFYEEPAPGDVSFDNEGADSTEQTAAAMP